MLFRVICFATASDCRHLIAARLACRVPVRSSEWVIRASTWIIASFLTPITPTPVPATSRQMPPATQFSTAPRTARSPCTGRSVTQRTPMVTVPTAPAALPAPSRVVCLQPGRLNATALQMLAHEGHAYRLAAAAAATKAWVQAPAKCIEHWHPAGCALNIVSQHLAS